MRAARGAPPVYPPARPERISGRSSSFRGVEKSYAIQAGREIRVMVKPNKLDESDCVLLVHDIVKRIEAELEYPGQIKVVVIRETRMVDYAK